MRERHTVGGDCCSNIRPQCVIPALRLEQRLKPGVAESIIKKPSSFLRPKTRFDEKGRLPKNNDSYRKKKYAYSHKLAIPVKRI